MIAVAYKFRFLCDTVPFPFHFGGYEFHGRKPTVQMGFAFPILYKGRHQGGQQGTPPSKYFFGGISGWLKKFFRTEMRALESARLLSSVGKSNFFQLRYQDGHSEKTLL